MATAPQKQIHKLPDHRGQQTYGLGSKGCILSVYEGDDLSVPETDIVFPAGCTGLYVQGRLAGDFYAEITGKSFCRAATAQTAIGAVNAALAQVPA